MESLLDMWSNVDQNVIIQHTTNLTEVAVTQAYVYVKIQ